MIFSVWDLSEDATSTNGICLAADAAFRDENMAVRVEAENIAEGRDGDNRVENGILSRNDIPEKNLQRFPSATA